MASERENAYWKAVRETDAAWNTYCRYPTDDTWDDWVQLKKKEVYLSHLLSPQETERIQKEAT